ncbi:hypothetical protein [Myroides odoratus]|uniref:Uncharacterized protein n=1 Tax=Myroides odoratus TaxID=256 RepID=A0A9Q7E7T9_MYROD|nr:hypothetical protein [Myroides odoratus]EHQ41515.1 hypothetical protein Myrod_0679 [Myroides odoratus DSM 2801]EKB02692.1 hypothetical protein HMPREF9716_03721 [Myroides odoratus CIP 103059]QQT98937.1 hypothetical protein I6I88_12015 [Myroides odoratus]WQD58876.1 hypothetical protein U0010_06960 [Myroides odoratus]STZ28778.1 Uncharacterised protein [Myroides odoratus]
MNTQNEPKYFIITKGEGSNKTYYNGKYDYFSDLANATYATTNKEAQAIITVRQLIGAKVETITESELVYSKANAMTKITIMSASLSVLFEHTLPNLPIKSQTMKGAYKHLKHASEAVKGLLPDYNHFIKQKEEDVDDVQGCFDELIHEIASINFVDLTNLTGLIQAYKEDEKSMIGIARKVLKEAERKKKEKVAQKNQLSILDQI